MPNDLSLDDNGQPLNRYFGYKRVKERTTDELIGICKGVIADGQVVEAEAKFILNWMHANPEVTDEYPGWQIYQRLNAFLEDDMLDQEEGEELKELLLAATGEDNKLHATHNMTGSLPLDKPMPVVVFKEQVFCFTGAMATMIRRKAMEAVEQKGGNVTNKISKKVDYLVLGCMGSRDWLHSTHGLKIEKAVKMREQGIPIKIISEEHWFVSL